MPRHTFATPFADQYEKTEGVWRPQNKHLLLPKDPKANYRPPSDLGYQFDPKAVEEYVSKSENPIFRYCSDQIKGAGENTVVLLYRYLQLLCGGDYPTLHQAIGDCVSFAAAAAVDNLRAIQIVKQGLREAFTALTATEPIYGGSRFEIGGRNRGPAFRGDGSNGVWAVEYLKKYGILLRQMYEAGGTEYDFSTYSGTKARQYGAKGVPDALESIAREHPILTASLCQSWEEVRDAIAAGYPVIVCSNVGFGPTWGNKRDAEGFLRPRNSWAHAMLLIAIDTAYRRPGALCVNSWSKNWVSGPKRHEQPDGSFWIDAEVVDRMARQNDTSALSQARGFVLQTLPRKFMSMDLHVAG
jgi:hypothetical protein